MEEVKQLTKKDFESTKSFSESLFDGKTISESSKNLYLKNLVRLNDGQPLKNLNFLKDVEAIQKKLDELKPNTRRTYIIAIVSLLKSLIDQPKMKKLYDRYYPSLEAINKDLKTSNEKTPKETDNWLNQDEIKSKFDELKTIYTELMESKSKKITEAQYNKLLDLVVLGLYVLQRPRRNMDYQDMTVTTQKAKVPKKAVPVEPETKDEPKTKTMSNVLNLADNKFEFNNYKTKGSYLQQTESLDFELRQIIDLYLKHHPLAKDMKKESVPFIVSHDGKAFTNNNDFTRLLYKIFGKKIGVSMLRKIFLTDKYKDTLNELKMDSQAMGTSTSTIQDHYIKE
jgi:hypothetical protein